MGMISASVRTRGGVMGCGTKSQGGEDGWRRWSEKARQRKMTDASLLTFVSIRPSVICSVGNDRKSIYTAAQSETSQESLVCKIIDFFQVKTR